MIIDNFGFAVRFNEERSKSQYVAIFRVRSPRTKFGDNPFELTLASHFPPPRPQLAP
jgi:hypothetical protein